MAEGYRIHYTDPSLWGSIVLVNHPGNPATGRAPKDYVFRLDANGDIIVSSTIWQRLQEIAATGLDHGFVFSNVVGNPPTQNPMSNGSDLEKRVFKKTHDGLTETEHKALRNLVPKGFHPKGKRA